MLCEVYSLKNKFYMDFYTINPKIEVILMSQMRLLQPCKQECLWKRWEWVTSNNSVLISGVLWFSVLISGVL